MTSSANHDPPPDVAPPSTASDSTKAPARLAWFGLGTVLFAVTLGTLAGVGTFTFGYGKGASYLSNDPKSCINCHVMQEQYDSWEQSSHRHVAVCNDCHLPHYFLGKYVTKAEHGFMHSLKFTTQDFHQPIEIKPASKRTTQNSCVHCHKDVVHGLLQTPKAEHTAGSDVPVVQQDTHSCVHCHADVGHAFRGKS